jgi:hypothetical protein
MKADRRDRSSDAESVEMGFSVVTLRTNQDTMVVATLEAPFIGVSGRQMAVAEYGTEVTKLGERGPYTIVHWNGRDGYLLTEQLLSDVEFESTVAAAEAAAVAELKAPARRFRFGFPWLQRVA